MPLTANKFNALFAGALRVGAIAIVFLQTAIISRWLGAVDAGDYFWCWFVVVLTSQFGRLGMDVYAMRRYAIAIERGQVDLRDYLRIRAYVIGATSLVMAILAALSEVGERWELITPSQHWMLLLLCPAVMGQSILFLVGETLKGLNEITLSLTLQLLALPVMLCGCLTIMKVVFPTSLVGDNAAFATSMISIVVAFVADRITVQRIELRALLSPSKEIVDSIQKSIDWLECRALFVVSLLTSLGSWPTHLLLGFYVDSRQYAAFHISNRIAQVTSIPLLAVNAVVPPKLARLHERGAFDTAGSMMIKTSAGLTATSAISLPFLWFFSSSIFKFSGIEWTFENQKVLLLLLCGQAVSLITGPVGYGLSMFGFAKRQSANLFVANFAGSLLAILLIPSIGLIGAAFSLTAALVLSNVLNFFAFHRILRTRRDEVCDSD